MASLKSLKNRIKSVRSIKKITQAMQLISAVRFRMMRTKKEKSRYYIGEFYSGFSTLIKSNRNEVVSAISERYKLTDNDNEKNMHSPKEDSRSNIKEEVGIYLVISADKGLCGSFNSAIYKACHNIIEGEDIKINQKTDKKTDNKNKQNLNLDYDLDDEDIYKQNKKLITKKIILCVGKKAYTYLLTKYALEDGNGGRTFRNNKILDIIYISDNLLDVKRLSYNTTDIIKNKIHELISHYNKISEIKLIYNSFISILKYNTKIEDMLPIEIESMSNYQSHYEYKNSKNGNDTSVSNNLKNSQNLEMINNEYLYEPDIHSLIKLYVSDYMSVRLYDAVLQSLTAEQTARMLAMDNATRNSDTLIQDLNKEYNKSRQAIITKELSEIISGMQAL